MRLTTLSENEIIITLISLGLLLLSAFICGTLMEKIKGPRVVGEIIGGMIIGGSCMFLLFPSLSEKIFFAYPEEGKVLNIFYQLGLIFLMFLSGYNTDIKVDRSNAKAISLVLSEQLLSRWQEAYRSSECSEIILLEVYKMNCHTLLYLP